MDEVRNDEAGRLLALRRLRVLDRHLEESFRELTELAAELCGTPVALLSFIDEDRQWVKAACGESRASIARDVSFCAEALFAPGILLVEDTLADPRYRDNPLVHESPPVRFYAGCPLVTADGFPVGTLCVIDHAPRGLGESGAAGLRRLARLAMAKLELKAMLLDTPATGDD